jgi:hypothetical protein
LGTNEDCIKKQDRRRELTLAIDLEVGQFTSPTSTGNQDITSVGFQPQLVLMMMNNRTAAGFEIDSEMTLGAAVSSSSRFHVSYAAQDFFSSCDSRHADNKCIAQYAIGPTLVEEADFVSFLSNGFRINWSTANASQRLIDYFCIGGISNVAIKQFTSATSTGNQAITGVGFQPDAMAIFAMYAGTAPPANATDARMVTGFTDGTNDRCVSAFVQDGTGNVVRAKKNNAVINSLASGGTILERASLNSFDSDGFTLNWSTVSGVARYYWAVCLKGVNTIVGTISQTSSGNQAYSIGHATKAAMFSMDGNTTDDTVNTSLATMSFGVADDNSDLAKYVSRDSAFDDALQADDSNDCIVDLDLDDGSTIFAGDIASLDSNGFTVNWSPVDVPGREVYYMSFSSGETIEAAAVCTGQSALTSKAEVTKEVSAQTDGQSATTSKAEVTKEVSAQTDGQSALTADTERTRTAQAAATGQSALTANGFLIRSAAAIATGQSNLVSLAEVLKESKALATGQSSLTATGFVLGKAEGTMGMLRIPLGEGAKGRIIESR